MTHEDQILIPLSGIVHVDMETVAMIGDGGAFGNKRGACHGDESLSTQLALDPSQELEQRPVTEYVEVIQEVVWNETQQVQNKLPSPMCSLLRGLTRCDHEHRRGSRDRTSGRHQTDSGSGGSVRGETREHAQTTIEVVIT